MNKVTKYMLKCVSYMIILVVFIFAMLLVGVKLFGIKIYTVLSGSMEPEYKVGSLIYVVEEDIKNLREDDVITFMATDKVVVTHRIEKVVNENGKIKFLTKGDANNFTDENFVPSSNVIGTPIFTIPYLGYVATFMQTVAGKFITAGVSLLLILAIVVIDFIINDKTKEIKQ